MEYVNMVKCNKPALLQIKKVNLVYRLPLCVIIYRSYKLLKTVWFFYPVCMYLLENCI